MTHKEPAADARSGTLRFVSAALVSTFLKGETVRGAVSNENKRMTHKEPATDARSGTLRLVSATLLLTSLGGEHERIAENEQGALLQIARCVL